MTFNAFSSRKKAEHVVGRLVVRRISELNGFDGDGQQTLFFTHRFRAFFTTSEPNAVITDETHRQHAIIEQVNADLKDSALSHLPSGIFTAKAASLVLAMIAFNLSRAIGTLAGTDLGKARSDTTRRKLIQIPAQISTSARKIVLHLSERWPWETVSKTLFGAACGPPRTAELVRFFGMAKLCRDQLWSEPCAGIQLLPVNASRRTSNSFTVCFLAVDITERMTTKYSAPAVERRYSETFWRSLTILMSRSA